MTWTSADATVAFDGPPDFPNSDRYLLKNLHVPSALCSLKPSENGWCEVDILVRQGQISTIQPTAKGIATDAHSIDADNSVLLSGLVDCHTHLDKAHVASFADFAATDLAGAIDAMVQNKATWTADQLQRRVEFSLKSAYAYGVRALRSHVDFSPDTPPFIGEVMQDAVNRWRGRIEIQLAPLANITYFEDPDFCKAIYSMAARHGRIGMFLYDQSDLSARLTPIFERANAQGWDIDLHVDEGLDPSLDGLNVVAQVAINTAFQGTVLCGHCVALNCYDQQRREQVITQAITAGLHFVALPTTNLYLQSRHEDFAPQSRGMAPVASLMAAGATVSLGADNVDDGFCAFGDFDPMAVLNLGAQLGHLHEPGRNFSTLITSSPAATMGLDWNGVITPGAPADFVLLAGRTSREISQRTTAGRQVVRAGKWLSQEPPDFRELC